MTERLPLVILDTGETLLSGKNKGELVELPALDTLPKSIVNLAEVDNTSDLNKPVSTATTAAIGVLEQTILAALLLKADQTALAAALVDIGTLQTLLTSDDTTLDELQEVVDFIKINKTSLDNLGIGNIAGLQAALDATASTAADVGLGNVDNTSDADKPVSTAQAAINTATNTALSDLQTLVTSDDTTLDDLQEIVDFIKINKTTLDALSIASIAGLQTALDGKLDSGHGTDVSNPHNVTATQVGLGNVENTADLDKVISTAQAAVNAAVQVQFGDIDTALDAINGEVV